MTDRKISRIECIPAPFFLFSYMYGMVNEYELFDRNYGEQKKIVSFVIFIHIVIYLNTIFDQMIVRLFIIFLNKNCTYFIYFTIIVKL